MINEAELKHVLRFHNTEIKRNRELLMKVIERKYYTKDNIKVTRQKKKLIKDIDACIRCGFDYDLIIETLTNTDNEYKNIINEL